MLIGEIRDHETAQIAIEASLTGHLVLSTLHTNDAPSAITRLTEMDIEPFLVGSALDSVVAQRLARRLCDRCQEAYQHDAGAAGELDFPVASSASVLFRPAGCAACSNTGYRGRIALHEVMAVNEEIERLAVARASSAEIMPRRDQRGHAHPAPGRLGEGRHGLTSIEEVLRVVA